MNTTNTRWTKWYHSRFYFKHKFLQEKIDKINIKEYTIKIANHSDPNNIGGCESCPSGDSNKLKFNTGWIIIYQIKGSEIYFLNFYKHVSAPLR